MLPSCMELGDLTLLDKVKVLYAKGEFIVSIRYYGFKVNLFCYHKELFEVFYNHKLDRIEKIELLDNSSSRMKFYADQIKLTSGLLS